MGQIRVLPDHLANQIAAGEVVERPASALKELIENAIDAGATRVTVTLEAGGKRRIRVEDDGRGMDREDCLMAVERHATSKLTRAEDLFSIRTLGFRGEALPSIASVSRFCMESRTHEAEAGVKLEMNGSKLMKVSEISRNPGTTVTVDQLFFNIPARRKFLRTTDTELSWMVNLVTQYSFANLDKHFSLTHNGKLMIDVPPVNSLKERIYQHFGKQMVDELVPVAMERDWLQVGGMTSTPNYIKSSRQYQYLFVNGRLVKDRVLSHAITEAYEGFGEGPRRHPVVFLFLQMPSTEVDVNVHPAKTEVKFIHSNVVHDGVRDALRKPLLEMRITTPYRFREEYHAHPSQVIGKRDDPWNRARQQQQGLPGSGDGVGPLFDGGQSDASAAGTQAPGSPGAASGSGADERAAGQPSAYERFRARHADTLGDGMSPQTTQALQQPVPPTQPPMTRPADNDGLFDGDPHLQLPHIIGQFRESYILAEQAGDLLLIDQHVAHERILYDQVSRSLAAGEVERQQLLVPVQVELTPKQAVALREILDEVQRFGFDLDPFDGNTYVIREAPAFLGKENLEHLVVELIEKAQGKHGETALEAMIDHYAATKACKAAVKINMRLTSEKMLHLLEALWATDTPLFCPHGRPIILRFRNDEIEKNFLRK